MTYKEWFKDLELDGNINAIHSLYCSVRDSESVGEFAVVNCGAGARVTVPGTVDDEYEFKSKSEREEFCAWLDTINEPGVEIKYEEWKANSKDNW